MVEMSKTDGALTYDASSLPDSDPAGVVFWSIARQPGHTVSWGSRRTLSTPQSVTEYLQGIGWSKAYEFGRIGGGGDFHATFTMGDDAAYLCFTSVRHGRSKNVWHAVYRVASKSPETTAVIAEGLRKFIQPLPDMDDGTLPVSFWVSGSDARTPNSPFATRYLQTADWSDARGNYPAATAAALDGLMAMGELDPDAPSGRLLLWHGPPGTGKTWAIRMLGRKWQSWCDMHYVTDPEAFFGSPAYMLSVVLDGDDGNSSSRWRVVVIEDADAFLPPDGKHRAGQALGRLLNLAEGMIGQGLRFLLLITTNDAVEHVHPAVSRPGRCLASVGFDLMGEAEALAWLAAHAPDVPLDISGRSEFSIADLYAVRGGKPMSPVSLRKRYGIRTGH